MFFKIATSSFQEMFLAIFRKTIKKKNIKKLSFLLGFQKFLPTEFLKYIKENFMKISGIFLKKRKRRRFLVN